jgi:hypothetical protein
VKFKVGQRVKVVPSAFCTRRVGYVSEIDLGSDGQYRYWLADGGLFSANELEAY